MPNVNVVDTNFRSTKSQVNIKVKTYFYTWKLRGYTKWMESGDMVSL